MVLDDWKWISWCYINYINDSDIKSYNNKFINWWIKIRKYILIKLYKVKTLLWGLYITLFSSIIAGIWVINTFNILHVNVIVEIGDIILIIICSFNILIFPLITRFIFKDIVEYIMSFN